MKMVPIMAPAAMLDVIDNAISVMSSTHILDSLFLYATNVVVVSNMALAAVNPRKWNEPGIRMR